MSAQKSAPFLLAVSGKELPLLRFESKKGNECFGVLSKKGDGTRYLSQYGLGIPALGDDLPTEATLVKGDDPTKTVKIRLDAGETESGNRKASFTGTVNVPGLGDRRVTVNLSIRKVGWNAIVKVIPFGENAGTVTDLADLW